MRHVATGSNVQIVPPTEMLYGEMTLSPDGGCIYFTRYGKSDRTGALSVAPDVRRRAEEAAHEHRQPLSPSRPTGNASPFRFVSRLPGLEHGELLSGFSRRRSDRPAKMERNHRMTARRRSSIG